MKNKKDWNRIRFKFIVGIIFFGLLLFAIYSLGKLRYDHEERNIKKCGSIGTKYISGEQGRYCAYDSERLCLVPGWCTEPSFLWIELVIIIIAVGFIIYASDFFKERI